VLGQVGYFQTFAVATVETREAIYSVCTSMRNGYKTFALLIIHNCFARKFHMKRVREVADNG
jgi:hypothetical protein